MPPRSAQLQRPPIEDRYPGAFAAEAKVLISPVISFVEGLRRKTVAFVSITRLRVRSWRYLPMFMWYALRSTHQAAKAQGSLAVCLLKDRRKTFWTGTVWTTDAAMKTFMLAGTHREAMRRLPQWCDEAAVVHWNQEASELPTWSEACARLHSEGRRSKVSHPSGAHMAHKFPGPRVGVASEFRLK